MGKVCVPLNEDLLKNKSLSMRVFLYIMGHTENVDKYAGYWRFNETCMRDIGKIFEDMPAARLKRSIETVMGEFFQHGESILFIEGRYKLNYNFFFIDVENLWNLSDLECNVLLQLCLMYARAYTAGRRKFFSISTLMVGAGYCDNNQGAREMVRDSLKRLKALGFIDYEDVGYHKLELFKVQV